MESRIRLFLLMMTSLVVFPSAYLYAAESKTASGQAEESETFKEMIQTEPLIQPSIKLRNVTEAQIDTENFEVGIFGGLMTIEDFGTKPVYGARVTYHVTEDIFFEGTLGFSTAGKTSQERFQQTVNFTDRNYNYYTVALGYNLLPGEAFIGRNRAFNTALYVLGGVGSTKIGGESHFTAMFGAGYRIVLTDWLAIHATARDHVFTMDIAAEQKKENSVELSLGATYFF